MDIFDRNLKGFDRWFIELADDQKTDLIVKWADNQIRRKTRVTVDMDFVAVFASQGVVVDTLGPGRHELETGAPILTAWLVDHVSNDRYYDLDLYFVNTKERTTKFGGVVDTVSTGEGTELVAKLRTYGMFAYKVADAALLLKNFWGTSSSSSMEQTEQWLSSQVMAAIREELPHVLGGRSLLSLGATQDATEEAATKKANITLAEYGLTITRFGELNINMSDEDAATLKKFVERKRLVELAGGYREFAVGEAFVGMGDGAGGGDAGSAMMLAMLMNQNAGGNLLPPAAPSTAPIAPTPVAAAACFACNGTMPAGSVFCPSCGKKQACTQCDKPLAGGTFCPSCGHKNA